MNRKTVSVFFCQQKISSPSFTDVSPSFTDISSFKDISSFTDISPYEWQGYFFHISGRKEIKYSKSHVAIVSLMMDLSNA